MALKAQSSRLRTPDAFRMRRWTRWSVVGGHWWTTLQDIEYRTSNIDVLGAWTRRDWSRLVARGTGFVARGSKLDWIGCLQVRVLYYSCRCACAEVRRRPQTDAPLSLLVSADACAVCFGGRVTRACSRSGSGGRGSASERRVRLAVQRANFPQARPSSTVASSCARAVRGVDVIQILRLLGRSEVRTPVRDQ